MDAVYIALPNTMHREYTERAAGLADVRIINAIHESARKGQPVPVSAVHKSERPGKAQEIKRPPVEKPETVGASSPHQD